MLSLLSCDLQCTGLFIIRECVHNLFLHCNLFRITPVLKSLTGIQRLDIQRSYFSFILFLDQLLDFAVITFVSLSELLNVNCAQFYRKSNLHRLNSLVLIRKLSR